MLYASLSSSVHPSSAMARVKRRLSNINGGRGLTAHSAADLERSGRSVRQKYLVMHFHLSSLNTYTALLNPEIMFGGLCRTGPGISRYLLLIFQRS